MAIVNNVQEKQELNDFYENSFWSKAWCKLTVLLTTAIVFILPLNLLKDISKLRFTTIFGIILILVISLVIAFQTPEFYNNFIHNNNNLIKDINWYNIEKAFYVKEMFFFKATGTIFFAYGCHYAAFPAYKVMKNKTEKRILISTLGATIIELIFYLLVGITGFLTCPINTPTNIITRNQMNKEDSDIIMTICRLLTAIMILVKIPPNYNQLRVSIISFLYEETKVTEKR